jgi:acyl carrier protein
MNSAEIELKVRNIVAQKFDVSLDQVQADTNLANELGLDSFAAVELMFELEEAFGLKIPDSEIEHIRTIRDIVKYLEEWMSKCGKG